MSLRSVPTRVCAHRGASSTHPENTLAAVRAALEEGAGAVEVDVRLSADGTAVVIHDDRLERTTDGAGPVGGRSAAELHGLDAGAWFAPGFAGEPLPLLADVVAACAGRADLLVEIKGTIDDAPGLVDAVVAVAGAAPEAVALLAFDHRHLERARNLAPRLPRVPLVTTVPADLAGMLEALSAAALGPASELVDAALVAAAHAAGVAVVAWTVDDPGEARRLAGLGVDLVVSNRPAEIAAALAL